MGALPNKKALLLAAGVAVALGVGVLARQGFARHATSRTSATSAVSAHAGKYGRDVLHVPHIPGSITLDGDTDDPGWTRPPGPARTGAFTLDTGAESRPYSDTRALWGDGHLYMALYAADEDIRTRVDKPDGPVWLDDSFRLVFSREGTDYAIEVSPKGIVTDALRKGGGAWDYSWSSGVHVSPELDGTVNQPSDMDEEWVIEMALPFESLGMKGESGETVDLAIKRCDTPKNSPRVCAGWEGRLVLE
jgi:hypothetical protein